MEEYHRSLLDVLTRDNQYVYESRTASDRLSVTSGHNTYDLSDGYPLGTTKRLDFENIVHELIWFKNGETNVKYLVDNDVPIWNDNAFDQFLKETGLGEGVEKYSEEWKTLKDSYVSSIRQDEDFAAEHGDLGPVYGKMWRAYPTEDGDVDQLGRIVEDLRDGVSSTRHIVDAWHPGLVEKMALPPCHTMYQFHKRGDSLDVTLSPQRSTDAFLGEPYNVASYALLTEIVANDAGLEPGVFYHHHGNHHLYCGDEPRSSWYKERANREWLRDAVQTALDDDRERFKAVREDLESRLPDERPGKERLDHVPLALEQLSREPYDKPKVDITDGKRFEAVGREDIVLADYEHHPGIRARMAV